MALCDYCQKFSFSLLYRGDYRHQPSFEALHKSAEGGCTLCTIIYQTLSSSFTTWERKPEGHGADTQIWLGIYPRFIGAHFMTTTVQTTKEQELKCWLGKKEDQMEASIDMVTSSDDPAAEHIKRRSIRIDPSDNEVFKLVNNWLYECSKQHPDPHCRIEASKLPTRLVDVGPADGSREPFLFQSHGESGKYLTLSYCWGSTGNLRTLMGNFDAHLKEIKYASLPKTIQHAVDITRKLNFQYLWVDALCIIQDHPNDWKSESPKMAQIYGNSFLTIAADFANDCSEGILHKRSPRTSVNIPYFLSSWIKCGSISLHEKWNYASGPLQFRGWTFQEKEFSRRLLSYGSQMINYTCKHSKASEEFSSFIPTSLGETIRGISQPFRFDLSDRQEALIYWYSCVRDYSQRNLTYKSDKLPAISGLAHEVGKAIRSPYRAGLWECDLIRGLLWRTESRAPDTHTISTRISWRAPSWSWASLDQGVSWNDLRAETPRDRRKTAVWVMNVSITTNLLQEDPMGEFSGGCLALEGSLKAARWIPYDSNNLFNPDLHKFNEVLVEAVPPNTLKAARSLTPSQEDKSAEFSKELNARIFAVCRFDDDMDLPSHLWCLLLTSRYEKPGPETDECEMMADEWDRMIRKSYVIKSERFNVDNPTMERVLAPAKGIMLASTHSGIPNEYRRVGYFDIVRELDWPTDPIKITIV